MTAIHFFLTSFSIFVITSHLVILPTSIFSAQPCYTNRSPISDLVVSGAEQRSRQVQGEHGAGAQVPAQIEAVHKHHLQTQDVGGSQLTAQPDI